MKEQVLEMFLMVSSMFGISSPLVSKRGHVDENGKKKLAIFAMVERRNVFTTLVVQNGENVDKNLIAQVLFNAH